MMKWMIVPLDMTETINVMNSHAISGTSLYASQLYTVGGSSLRSSVTLYSSVVEFIVKCLSMRAITFFRLADFIWRAKTLGQNKPKKLYIGVSLMSTIGIV